MVDIIPAILTNDPKELEEKIRKLEGVARLAEGDPRRTKRVQVDIVDGVFTENKTVFPEALESMETNVLLDIHLMTKDPVTWVEKCTRAMADRIIGQIEMMSSQEEFVGKVTEAGGHVGLAIDLDTPVASLDPVILNNLDVVLVMSVKAGFGGQKFDNSALQKIKELDQIRARDDTPFRICVDGGIGADNIKKVGEAGADEVAVGQSLFEGNLSDNIQELKKIVK